MKIIVGLPRGANLASALRWISHNCRQFARHVEALRELLQLAVGLVQQGLRVVVAAIRARCDEQQRGDTPPRHADVGWSFPAVDDAAQQGAMI